MALTRRSNPEGLYNGRSGFYSQTVTVSGEARTIYVAGQVARDEEGNPVGIGDIEAQTAHVFRNIGLCLADAGATLRDLVKITIYTTDIRLMPRIDATRRQFLEGDLPVSTLVEVSKLAHPTHLIEIDGIAVIR